MDGDNEESAATKAQVSTAHGTRLMLNGKTFYEILGVQPDAEDVVIKAAYRALSQRYHPDKWTGDQKVGSERMKELNHAYSILSDTDQRRIYDKDLQAKGRDSQYPESEQTEDILKDKVSEQDDEWQFAADFFPEINEHLDELKKVNYGLAFTYKATLVASKSFQEAAAIKQKLKTSFLERYFTSNKSYLDFAEMLIAQQNRPPLLDLNRAIRILGDSVEPALVIERIRQKYNLGRMVPAHLFAKWQRYAGPTVAIEILTALGYRVNEHKVGGFLGMLGVSRYQIIAPNGSILDDNLDAWDVFALTRDKIAPKFFL